MTADLPGATAMVSGRYSDDSGTVILSGVQAIVRLILAQMRQDRVAGINTAAFVSGYEGSPLAGLDLELEAQRELLTEHRVVFNPAVNEELAATSVAGSQTASSMEGGQHDGVVGFWYGKAPGLDRASDAIRHGNFAGAHRNGGVLLLVGDDARSKSSSIPSASEFALADLGIPTLCPGSPDEVIELGLHGVAMSRASGTWVALKVATDVADGWSSVSTDAPSRAQSPPLGGQQGDPPPVTGLISVPARMAAERTLFGRRLERAVRYGTTQGLNRVPVRGDHDRVGLLASGRTYFDLRAALQTLGVGQDALRRAGIRLIHLRMVHPLGPDEIREFVGDLQELVVVEEKRAFVETAIRAILFDDEKRPVVSGKHRAGHVLFPSVGALDPDAIATCLRDILAGLGIDCPPPAPAPPAVKRMLPLATRTPYFCSGCPHNRSTVVPEDALVGAGIGCHALVTRMTEGSVGRVSGMTQMGGEGAQWIGMEPFLDDDHLFQNIGDGTFTHSGSLAVRAAVAAKSHVTFKLLYNDAVAMTGGQAPAGRLSVPQVVNLLKAEGVARIIVTSEDPKRHARRLPRGVRVMHRDQIVQAQRELAAVPGVTVLIHDQECAAEVRRKRKRGIAPVPEQRVFINERICEGCGDCGAKSNCLSVEPVHTEYGQKTRIHQDSCNLDFSCLAGDCPAFMSVSVRGSRLASEVPDIPVSDLPPVTPLHRSGRANVRLCGIGGTGIVTAARVLGTAAVLDGRPVAGLDMTGLAQKGGAVTSDVIIGVDPEIESNTITAGRCDTYLVADVLTGASPESTAVLDRSRTTAIVSTSITPTGSMIGRTDVRFPEAGEAIEPILSRAHPDRSTALDMRAALERHLGSDAGLPIALLGAAYQSGSLPVTEHAIEQAIRIGGVAVESNLAAFRLGRLLYVGASPTSATVAPDRPIDPRRQRPRSVIATTVRQVCEDEPAELSRLLVRRSEELVRYQNLGYARRFLATVSPVIAAERRLGSDTTLGTAAAEHLFKLMAYKDEYEVARLALLPEVDEEIRRTFGPDAHVRWQLHPPVLRALGLNRKIALGPWFRPVFRVLQAMRQLRGTRLDPFGLSHVRREERRLIRVYCGALAVVAERLDEATRDVAIEIATLPDIVRGYEDIKLRSIGQFHSRLHELMQSLASSQRRVDRSISP